MFGVVDDERLEQEFAAPDIGFVSQRYEGSEFNIPSKLMNFMAYGLPILAAVNPAGEVARLVSESGAGWVVDSSNERSSRVSSLGWRRTRRSLVACGGRAPVRGRSLHRRPLHRAFRADAAGRGGLRALSLYRGQIVGAGRLAATTLQLGELVVDPSVGLLQPVVRRVDGSQSSRSRIIVLSLLRPRTPLGASRL